VVASLDRAAPRLTAAPLRPRHITLWVLVGTLGIKAVLALSLSVLG